MKYSDKKIGSAYIYIHIYHIYPIHILYTLRWWFHLGSAYLHIILQNAAVTLMRQWTVHGTVPVHCAYPSDESPLQSWDEQKRYERFVDLGEH